MKQNKPYIIGLTGTIGSGKSTCSEILSKKMGLPVIDADKIAYQVCGKDGEGLKAIVEAFGPEYRLENGEYNRELMSKTVFDSPEALEKLNALLHPIIKQEKERQLAALAEEPVVIYDCPLLFEAGEEPSVDEVLLVLTDSEIRNERLKERNNYTDAEIERRIKAQANDKEKIEKADTIIYNDGSIDDLERVLREYIKEKI